MHIRCFLNKASLFVLARNTSQSITLCGFLQMKHSGSFTLLFSVTKDFVETCCPFCLSFNDGTADFNGLLTQTIFSLVKNDVNC